MTISCSRGAGRHDKRVLLAAAAIAGRAAFAGTAADSGNISMQWLNAPQPKPATVFIVPGAVQ